MIPYDIFKHGTGVRVYGTNSKLYGTVTSIRETSNEYLEEFVMYDGTDQEVKARESLLVVELDDTQEKINKHVQDSMDAVINKLKGL